jgi:hypothetical protein
MGFMALMHKVAGAGGWCDRLAPELHPGFFGRTPCLALVTRLARAYQVIPGMSTSEEARNNMVYRKFPGLVAAVLTGVIVPNEYLSSAQSPLHAWALDEISKDTYRHGRAVNNIRVVLQNLGLASPEHDYRPPCPANIERLVILVEDKDRGVDHYASTWRRF